MKWNFEDRSTNGVFTLLKYDRSLRGEGILKNTTINSIVYNRHKTQTVVVDNVSYRFPANSILPLMLNQHFVFERPEELVAWQFNRDFYCIVDHDTEVGCVGFLFYGIQHPLFVPLSEEEALHIGLIEQLSTEDMQTKDRMQGEMLRTLLKRLIIYITRIAKRQASYYRVNDDCKMDLVRMFNVLVEGSFKQEHEVQFYADALNKSPKTLSNLFATLNCPPPSRIIQNRIILEAKRLLHFTDRSAKEIAYELGFDNPAHFSRFFKQHYGNTVSDFRRLTG